MDQNLPQPGQPEFAPDDLFAQIDALQRALEAERAARAEAEQASAAKSELLATVSHEVRTPIGAIISMADLLMTTNLDEKQRHYADTLHQSGRGLLAILNDILDYSKLSAGRFELEAVRFDFTAVMQSVGEALAARAGEKGLNSSVQITEGCPQYFVGDGARIRQVLDNLVDNALKFTEAGSVTVRAGFGLQGEQAILRFEVCDTGIGLSEARKEGLFEPYAQGDSSVASKYGGTGLGLSIARRLTELMGGEMGCESVPGHGSIFWFTVRLKRAGEEPATGDSMDIGSSLPGGPLSGRVLIVEDNLVNQMLIQAYLDNFGVSYETADNGRAALDALSREPFDVVLMDIMMPEMDGLETTRQIRALGEPVSKIPVIALTANAMNGDRETYLASGMDGYVSKPLGADELFAALAEYLASDPAHVLVSA